MEYYTHVCQHKGKILYRGVDSNGSRFTKKLNYKPYVFLKSNEKSKYKTVYDVPVVKKNFNSIYEAKDFIKKHEDIENFDIYGLTDFPYTFIYDNFPGQIPYNPKEISVVSLDIENKMTVKCDIPTAVSTAPNEITAITISRNDKIVTFSTCDILINDPDVTYYKCEDEWHLLKTFLTIWNTNEFSPDVITGWNIEFYDVPYLTNRIRKILGEEYVKLLSPWGIIRPYEVEIKGKLCTTYEFVGIANLDYMKLYKKFVQKPRESYTLDYISSVELEGVKKLDYSEYNGLDDLLARNPTKYIEYNIHDVRLVNMLENKLKLIELCFAIAYTTKVNYNDCFTSVKKWDVLIHNYLMDRDTVVEPNKSHIFADELVGGHVKPPIVGMHDWVIYFDLTSLYTHLIMHYNISPEKFVRRRSVFPPIEYIINGAELNLNENSLTANGCEYRKDSRGFLPSIMKSLFDGRKASKDKMIELKKQYQLNNDPNLKNDISKYDNLQGAFKVVLNEGYGALANIYNRWFNFNAAESITMGGQLSIRWIEKKLNEYFNNVMKTQNYDYVVYCDTDSVVVRVGSLVNTIKRDGMTDEEISELLFKIYDKKIKQFLADSYQELSDKMNSYEQAMHMKLDSISSKFCILAKKMYLMNVWNQEGVQFKQPEIKTTGLKAIRAGTPQICKDAMKKCFDIIMNSSNESDLHTYVDEFKTKFYSSSFIEIAGTSGIKSMSDYEKIGDDFKKGTPFHVKGAISYNDMLEKLSISDKYEKITNGDKIKICYIKTPNPFKSNVIAAPKEIPPEFNVDKYLDYNTQYEKTFVKGIKPILDTIGWHTERRNTLDNFWS